MKKILTILIASISMNALAQKTPPPQMVRLAGTSDILKTDKRLPDLAINKTRFNVYLGYQKPNEMRQQEKRDTLQVYKITRDKLKFSHLEIVKFATRKGKIIEEGKYAIMKDTLIVTQNSYDYIGSYCLTTKYVTDKYGLKKISDNLKAIKLEKLTDRHLKPAEMLSPPEIK